MAELIFKRMVADIGLAPSFSVSSFGTSSCEEGSPIYAPAKRTLERHGVEGTHNARTLSLKDVVNNDYILVMDSANLFDVLRLTGGAFGEKIYKLLSFTSDAHDVADPWYTLDFERAYADIEKGCAAFLDFLLKERAEGLAYDRRH